MYKAISECRICGNTDLLSVLDLGHQALTGIFPLPGEGVEQGPLELVKCREDSSHTTCGLVQLRHSFDPQFLYTDQYGYRSGLNASMVAHLGRLAAALKTVVPLAPGDVVLDIGSNDGTLLRAMDEPGLTLVGMDPTGVKFKQYYPDHIRLIPDFFSSRSFLREAGQVRAKVVTSVSMFYDLESPLEFMREVHEILADDGVWLFEQSYLPLMLQANSYDTVCHEHLEYYSLRQICWMADRAGLKIIDVSFNDVNGGSFSVMAARSTSDYEGNSTKILSVLAGEDQQGLAGLNVYRDFNDRVHLHRTRLMEHLDRSLNDGKRIFGYGASTKGNVVLQFCGITPRYLPYIAEVNSDKFGHVTPQTSIPIISEREARAMKPDCFLVLPWHFRDFIVQREAEYLNSGGSLLFALPEIALVSSTAPQPCGAAV